MNGKLAIANHRGASESRFFDIYYYLNGEEVRRRINAKNFSEAEALSLDLAPSGTDFLICRISEECDDWYDTVLSYPWKSSGNLSLQQVLQYDEHFAR